MTQPGLQDLPVELLQEIFIYIPDLPFPFTRRPFPGSSPFLKEPLSIDQLRVQRTSTLRSLSQTCRMLRELTRPLAWEVIEVVSVRKVNAEERRRLQKLVTQREKNETEYQQQLRRELWRQLCVVLEDENLRTNLRRVSVIVTESSAQAALKLFEAFPTFPNLHTIQLFSLSASGSRPWERDLSSLLCSLNTPLRSVKNLVLPEFAKGLLRLCPALEAVVATLDPSPDTERDAGRDMLKEIFNHCPSVKHLRGFPMKWPTDVEPLVQSCPQLDCLCFDDRLSYPFYGSVKVHQQFWTRAFQALSTLKRLRHITLSVGVYGFFDILPMHQFSIMHCIMILGGVYNANLEEYEDEANVDDPFTSPFPAALLPICFLKKIIPCEVPDQGTDMPLEPQDHGLTRTLTVDIAGFNRPVAIFSVAPPAKGNNTWPRLLSMQVGYRSDDTFEELYDLMDIPLDIYRQPDPSSNRNLSSPRAFCNDFEDLRCVAREFHGTICGTYAP